MSTSPLYPKYNYPFTDGENIDEFCNKLSQNIVDQQSQQFCNRDNVEDCLNFLNQDLVSIGMYSLFNEVKNFHVAYLINTTYELVQRCKKEAGLRNLLEESKHKAICEVEHMKCEKFRLKNKIDCLDRELNLTKNKLDITERECISKETKIKSEKDEVRCLQATLRNRDLQHKKATKKLESECNKLKERLSNIMNDKNDRKNGIVISSTLLRRDGKRGKWRDVESTNAYNMENMHKDIIQTFDNKMSAILNENQRLRMDIKNFLDQLVRISGRCSEGVKTSCQFNTTKLPEGLFEMPYLMVRDDVRKVINEQLESLIGILNTAGFNCDNDDKENAKVPPLPSSSLLSSTPLISSSSSSPPQRVKCDKHIIFDYSPCKITSPLKRVSLSRPQSAIALKSPSLKLGSSNRLKITQSLPPLPPSSSSSPSSRNNNHHHHNLPHHLHHHQPASSTHHPHQHHQHHHHHPKDAIVNNKKYNTNSDIDDVLSDVMGSDGDDISGVNGGDDDDGDDDDEFSKPRKMVRSLSYTVLKYNPNEDVKMTKDDDDEEASDDDDDNGYHHVIKMNINDNVNDKNNTFTVIKNGVDDDSDDDDDVCGNHGNDPSVVTSSNVTMEGSFSQYLKES